MNMVDMKGGLLAFLRQASVFAAVSRARYDLNTQEIRNTHAATRAFNFR